MVWIQYFQVPPLATSQKTTPPTRARFPYRYVTLIGTPQDQLRRRLPATFGRSLEKHFRQRPWAGTNPTSIEGWMSSFFKPMVIGPVGGFTTNWKQMHGCTEKREAWFFREWTRWLDDWISSLLHNSVLKLFKMNLNVNVWYYWFVKAFPRQLDKKTQHATCMFPWYIAKVRHSAKIKNILKWWHPVKEMFRTESANKKPRVNKKSTEFASDFHKISQFLKFISKVNAALHNQTCSL